MKSLSTPVRTKHLDDDGNDFDNIGLGASYSIQGLTFSGAYYQQQDTLSIGDPVKKADSGQYALGIKFSQDNWVVAAMYGSEEIAVPSCTNTVVR